MRDADAPVAGAASPRPATSAPAVATAPVASARAAVASARPSASASPALATGASASPALASASPAPGPHIYAVSASPAVVHAGQAVAFAARTSPDVETVTASVSAYKLTFVRTAPGVFSLSFAIPANVPGVFHGTYALDVVAREKGGASASRTLSVTFL